MNGLTLKQTQLVNQPLRLQQKMQVVSEAQPPAAEEVFKKSQSIKKLEAIRE
jgi:hypothetical protein